MHLKFLIILLALINFTSQEFIYEEEPINLIAIGDWGGIKNAPYTTTAQLNVALGMQLYSEFNKLSFVLSLGDNIYPNGVISVDDERFDNTYRNVYRKNGMENVPWYLILGNHDHRNNNGIHQIEYSKKDKLWNLPDYFYDLNLSIKPISGSENKTVKLIMIDTTILCNLFDDRDKIFYDKINDFYFKWLKNTLENSKNFDSIFVIGHHTIVSQMSGRSRSKCMYMVNLLLLDYGVTFYISGHDHTLQYNIYNNIEKKQTIHYLISGAGSNVYKKPNLNLTSKSIKNNFYWNDENTKAGFLTLSLYSDSFLFQFHDYKSNILYSNRVFSPNTLNLKSDTRKNCAVNLATNFILLILIFKFFSLLQLKS